MIYLVSKKRKRRKFSNFALLIKKLTKITSKIYKMYKYIWNTFSPNCPLTNRGIKNEFHLQNSLLTPYCYYSHYYHYKFGNVNMSILIIIISSLQHK